MDKNLNDVRSHLMKEARETFALFHPTLLRDKDVPLGVCQPMTAVRDVATHHNLNYAEYDALKRWMMAQRKGLKHSWDTQS